MIDTKDITKEMQTDRAFIIAAVSCDLIGLIKKEHDEWLDNGGYQPYYDLVIELVDYMMFTEGSTYLRFLEAQEKDKDLCFTTFADDCFDWFHMRLAVKLVTEELLHEVCFGDPKKYFARVEAEKKETAKKEEAPKKKMVKQVIPPAQVAIIQRALNVLELSLNEQCKLYHDDNIAHTTFDILTLRGLLSGEVSVVHPKEISEAFSHHHNVDWPDYGDEFPLEEL